MAAQLLNEKSQSDDDGAVELEQGLNSEPEQPKVESEYAGKSREELEKMIADQKEIYWPAVSRSRFHQGRNCSTQISRSIHPRAIGQKSA